MSKTIEQVSERLESLVNILLYCSVAVTEVNRDYVGHVGEAPLIGILEENLKNAMTDLAEIKHKLMNIKEAV